MNFLFFVRQMMQKRWQRIFVLVVVCIEALSASPCRANGVQLSGLTVLNRDTTNGFTMIRFDLAWNNSWRIGTGSSNWDAAWVFFKFRVGAADVFLTGGSGSTTTITVSSTSGLRAGMPIAVVGGNGVFSAGTVVQSITNATQFVASAAPTTALSGAMIRCSRIWEHAFLNNTGQVQASESTIYMGLLTPASAFNATTNPALGAFVYRSIPGLGPTRYRNLMVRWNYSANGISNSAWVEVRAYAVEMVYIPGNANFNVGGGGGTSALTSTTISTATASTAPSGTGTLGGQSGGYPTGQTAPSASWPNGYAPIYCMKYEISQGQYRDFLNSLTRTQQSNRISSSFGLTGNYVGGFIWDGTVWSGSESTMGSVPLHRIGIRIVVDSGGINPRVFACDLNPSSSLPADVNQSDDGEWIAMGFLTWMDGCAYLDWAGLRLMTELEFEKICRGTIAAVTSQYAWGSVTYTRADSTHLNAGTASEVNGNTASNVAVDNMPNVRHPVRVGSFAKATTTRQQSGASFYGVLDLSGNLWEQTVPISSAVGRSYTGLHGDGTLSRNGHATTSLWPGIVSGEVTGSNGYLRGGSWQTAAARAGISDRAQGNSPGSRFPSMGFRGVRSAP